MRSEGLSRYFTDLHFTLIGLIIFFVFFIGMVVFVSRRARKPFYDRMANLPLDERQEEEQNDK